MRTAFFLIGQLCLVTLLALGCQKDQVTPTVTIDIKVPDPVITTLGNGSKKLDFNIEVTQTGDFFYQDFDFKLLKTGTTIELDSYHTQLSSAHEFITRSVVVPSGSYQVKIFIGPADSGAGSGSVVVVP